MPILFLADLVQQILVLLNLRWKKLCIRDKKNLHQGG